MRGATMRFGSVQRKTDRRAGANHLALIGLLLSLIVLAGCTFQVMPEGTTTPPAEEEATGTPTAEEEATGTPMTEEATGTPAAEEEVTGTPMAEEEATGTPIAEEEATATPMAEEEATATPMAEEDATAMPTAEPEEEGTATPAAEEEASGAAVGDTLFAYIGTYTRGAPGGWSEAAEATHPEGVYVFRVDPTTGDMTHIQTVPSDNPSWVAIHPSQDTLYVGNEISDYEGADAGSLEAYAIDDETGELTFLNRIAISSIPAQIAVDPTGSYVAIANYVGGTFQLASINDDGSLGEVTSTHQQSGSGPNSGRQEAPHPHAVVFDPSGQYIATADLGTDQVQIFQISDGELELVDGVSTEPGAGPRHVAFAPSGDYLYVINELNATIDVFPFDSSTGQLDESIQTISTVSEDFPEEKSTAEILVHPSGRFLYGSNRKQAEHPEADAIVAFSIDQTTGMLTLIGHTTENIQFPRAFAFDPTGTWLYAMNQKGDTIVQFEIDQETGELSPTGVVIDTPVPVSMALKTE